jgi:hypothetical protein
MGFVRFPYANVAHNLGWLFRWPWNTLVWLVTLVVLFAWLSVLITSLLGFILIWKLAPEVMLWPLGIANHCLIDADRDL